jgi:hypothetical protein
MFLAVVACELAAACHQKQVLPPLQCKPVSQDQLASVEAARRFILASRFNGALSQGYCIEITTNCVHCRARGDVLVMFQPKDYSNAVGAVISPTQEHPPILQLVE